MYLQPGLIIPRLEANGAPPNSLAGFEGSLRGGGREKVRKRGKTKEKGEGAGETTPPK